MRIALVLPLFLTSCGFIFSEYGQYCEDYVDCIDGNEDDEKACQIQLDADKKEARVYGCDNDFEDYMECMKEDAECRSDGGYDYWSAGDECLDEADDYYDCIYDESEFYGGSSSGYDTGF